LPYTCTSSAGEEAAATEKWTEDRRIVTLTAKQEKIFAKGLKIGALKLLHKRQLLTDWQLKQLLEMQNR